MISKETLKAVHDGILTDEQLDEALKHYRSLAPLLTCHGDLYRLTTSHVLSTLETLERFKEARKESQRK